MNPEEIADYLALKALVEEYASTADTRDYDGYRQLFAPDAVFTGRAPGADKEFMQVHGSDEIGQMLHANDAFTQTFHAIHNFRCTVDGDRATGVTYCVARHYRETDSGADVVIVPLRYHDAYVRTSGGWRFSSREICFTWAEKAVADPAELAAWIGDS